jgi:2-polyprenyl-6-methoxyphenol hydroxylase-like FAD-dependent oxidoreductase
VPGGERRALSPRSLDIGVVGCGVAGQAAAILLADDGHRVTVFERFSEPRPVGAGLLLQPTGLAVLRALGLVDGALADGGRVVGLEARTHRGRVVLDLAYADLHPAAHGLGIRRSTLFDLLHGRLKQSAARLVTAAEIADVGDGHVVDVAGRRHGRFDLIVVADGAHSALRARVMPNARAPLYPWGCIWTTVPDSAGLGAGGFLRQRVRGTREMMGLLPVGRDHLTIYWSLPVAALAPDQTIDLAAWRRTAKALWPEASGIIDRAGDFTRATYRHVALPSWSTGSVLFIGDAAHGTSPQLGQGANLGLLDAHALARSIAEGADLASALALFARRRSTAVRFYRQASHLLSPFFQSRFAALGLARDLFMGLSCRVPGVRGAMTSTLAGVRRGWLGAERLDEEGRYRLASDAQRPGVRPKRATKWRVM